MRKIHKTLWLFLSIFLYIHTSSQAVGTPYIPLDKVPFSFMYGGTGADRGSAVIQTPDGGYLIGGASPSSMSGDVQGTTHGARDFWIAKLNRYGRVEWQKLYGGSQDESASDNYESTIQTTNDGGYIIACNTTSSASGDITGTNHGGSDVWVFKINATGNIQWQKLYGGSGNESVRSLIRTSDGGYLMSVRTRSSANGDITGTNHGGDDCWIVKLNTAGNITWQKLYGGSGFESFSSVKQNSDGTYICAGSTNSASGDITGTYHGGSTDFWVVKLNTSGNIVWQSLYGGDKEDAANGVSPTADGGYIVFGQSSSSGTGDVTGTTHGNGDCWLVKINGSGAIQWQKLYGGNNLDAGNSVYQTGDGNYILFADTLSSANGDITETSHGSYDIWVAKVGTSGNILWQKLYGSSTMDILRCVAKTSDNGYALMSLFTSVSDGDVTDAAKGSGDYWVLRLDASGNIILVPDERQNN